VNLWSANIASLLGEVSNLKGASKLKLLGLAARAFSTNQWKILHKINHIGKNCDIHPSAYIEGSIIGDNVRVGAGTVIRESKIGNNCNIENGVVINFSVLGNNCYIGDGAVIRYSVMYPGAFTISSLISCSILGRDTFLGDGVTLTDFRFDGQSIKVMKNKTVINTDNTFIGSCLGHRVYLGAGTIVSSGRSVPGGLRIIPEDSRVISKFDANGTSPGFQRIQASNQG
jgi:bifunctional UDP-N-acetylglucosamine pyrophosphorylase/glucosamine-1-phosphate N-acetyltransferase